MGSVNSLLADANALLLEGRYLQALKLTEQMVDVKGGQLQKVLYVQLYAYNALQYLEESFETAKKLSKFNLKSKKNLLEFACLYTLLGKSKQARKYLQAALKLAPKDNLLAIELGLTFEHEGNNESALKFYQQVAQRCLGQNTISYANLNAFNRMAGIGDLSDKQRIFLRDLLDTKALEKSTACQIMFILAKDARFSGDIDNDIRWLLTANQLAGQIESEKGLRWTKGKSEKFTRELKEVFDRPCPEWLEVKGRGDIQPIFILAMPRSGTTLIEQILGAHSDVGNTGESMAMQVALVKSISKLGLSKYSGENAMLHNVTLLDNVGLEKVADSYASYCRLLTNKRVYTDKNLSNVKWVGLLANLFSKAKFIHVVRDPLDSCTSLMQQNLQNIPYSTNPKHTLLEYAEYRKQMDYWRDLYPDRVYYIEYEKLVSNPETELKLIFKFLGLTWDDRVLDFSSRENSVRTPSGGQVRQGLNVRSVQKWHKYKVLIQPAIDCLEGELSWLKCD